jgi:hypothetical protein
MQVFKEKLSKTAEVLLKVAAISTAVLALFNVYSFYRNELWKPDIKVQDVDYNNGIAHLLIDGREFVLRGDSVYHISYEWGIKFGYTPLGNGKRIADRIEITKRGMVAKIYR